MVQFVSDFARQQISQAEHESVKILPKFCLCNLQCNFTFGRCKIGKYMFPSQFANIFLTYQAFVTNLHRLKVELRCKLKEKLHRVTVAKGRRTLELSVSPNGTRAQRTKAICLRICLNSACVIMEA